MSFTVVTPFYSEDVIYTKADLERENTDGVTVLLYLQVCRSQPISDSRKHHISLEFTVRHLFLSFICVVLSINFRMVSKNQMSKCFPSHPSTGCKTRRTRTARKRGCSGSHCLARSKNFWDLARQFDSASFCNPP